MTNRFGGWVLALGAAVMLGGCSEVPVEPNADAQQQTLTLRYDAPGSLVQTIRLSTAEPTPGDTLWIESTVVNEGGQPVSVESRICGLDLRTELRFAPQVRCGGYSMQGQLAPGDSVRSTEGGVLTSGPGTYSVRLRHLLQPEKWVTFQVTVRQR